VRKLEAVNLSAPTDSTGLHFVKLEGIDDTKLDQDIMQMLRYFDLEAMKPMGLITLILLHVAASFPEHLKFQKLLIPKDGTLFEELHLLAQEAVKTGQYHQIRRLGNFSRDLHSRLTHRSRFVAKSKGSGARSSFS
jgi:hypothetical protein